jgi:hypothetical protein
MVNAALLSVIMSLPGVPSSAADLCAVPAPTSTYRDRFCVSAAEPERQM